MLSEFALIDRLLSHQTVSRDDVTLAAGDDCAAVCHRPDQQQILTTDTLIAGRHFLPVMPAELIGHRALAVNLSDLAAMGAEPAWALCSLNLPSSLATESFIDDFARGLFALAETHNVMFIGGNMTQADILSIGITAIGHTPAPITRSDALPGDYIFVSGHLGAAAAGLAQLLATDLSLPKPADFWSSPLIGDYAQPMPQVALGLALRELATALIDCSDGFAQDVGHILQRSNCRALIDATQLPRPIALHGQDTREVMRYMLNGGDDYQLIGTCRPADFATVMQTGRELDVPIQLVGVIKDHCSTDDPIEPTDRIDWKNTLGIKPAGWDHFAQPEHKA